MVHFCHLQILVLIPVPDDLADGARGCRPAMVLELEDMVIEPQNHYRRDRHKDYGSNTKSRTSRYDKQR